MVFLPFHRLVPFDQSLAVEKMKSFVFYNDDSERGEPPSDTYILFENYCCDKKCDCRKVMINFAGKNSGKIFATITYGWEDLDYYTKWLFGDRETAKDMKGPALEPGGRQSIYAYFLLDQFKIFAKNSMYNEDLKRHYGIFKNYIKNMKGNSPCLCHSGRTAQTCCFQD